MRKFLPAFAIFAVMAAPASGQADSGRTGETEAQSPSAEKPKMVTKEVCRRVKDEVTIGQLVAKTRKVCRKVQVPVETQASQGEGENHAS